MFAWRGTPRDSRAYESARALREAGASFKQIARELGVSPATAHMWTRDIELTVEQRRALRTGPCGPADRAAVVARAETWRRKCRARRAAHQLVGRRRAAEFDPLHLAGCMLYWAEGSKARNAVKLANSDVCLVAFFCRFLRESLGVEDTEIRLSLNVYMNNGLTIHEIEQHWLLALGLPRSCLRKHTLNAKPTSSSGLKRNKLPYGVATVTVHSTRLAQHIYGAIQEYGAFEQPAWLN